MKMKRFIMDSNNIDRDSYVWNMIGSMIMAFQSVIMLMILTRTVGIVSAGIFTIAFANANLFLTIGKYGMRNFQVSDVREQFTFAEYLSSRWITSITMIVVSIAYVIYSSISNGYSFEKSMVIIWMCLFKVIDAIEDIYQGMYQQRGRLDIASKAMALRMIFTIFVFGVVLIVSGDQLMALVISTIFTTFLFIVFTKWTYEPFQDRKGNINGSNLIQLLKNCFPLFAGAFLSFYIGNAPKYAIDRLLSDEMQACYGFIAMPVFVIGLLNGFIFNPMLFQMSKLWIDGKIEKFIKKTAFQVLIIVGISVVCIIGAYLIGVPVLSFMYNTDLSPYKAELIVLLIGGGFLGLSGLLSAVITIIRFQKSLAWGYAVVAIVAYLCSETIVRKYEMMGASVLYAVLMGILFVCFCILFVVGLLLKARKDSN